ncbi:hypothetical protein OIU78_015814 [Salix suchowensis]|nr:hypothetical protein OIU78_015814 [Salix suchowensis]
MLIVNEVLNDAHPRVKYQVCGTRKQDCCSNAQRGHSITSPTHRLRELTEGNAWLMFEKYAFDDRSSMSRPDLEGIGTEIE